MVATRSCGPKSFASLALSDVLESRGYCQQNFNGDTFHDLVYDGSTAIQQEKELSYFAEKIFCVLVNSLERGETKDFTTAGFL